MGTVIAGFCLIGITFGAQPLLHAVVSEVLPREQRPQAQATINASAGIAAFIALCMGGALLRNGHLENYRIFLYVTAGIFLVATLGIALFYNPPPRELQTSLTTGQKLRTLDWIGYLLFTPGLVLFCVALSWSRNPYPWSNARIIGTFVVGTILMIAFFIYEWRFKKDGILNHGLFKTRNFPLALLTIFIEGVTFFSANSYFAFEISIFTGADLLISGLHFGVAFLSAVVFAFVSGYYASWRKSLRLPTTLGFLLILIASICMAATYHFNAGSAYWGIAVIFGAGLGTILPSLMAIAQLSTPPELISIASALVIANRSFGGTIGLAVNNAIFNSALATEIPKRIAAATLPLGLPQSSLGMLIGALTTQDQALLAKVPGASPQIIGAAAKALVRAYGIGFRNCWIAAACFGVVGVVGKSGAVILRKCTLLTSLVASLFFYDPVSEFNAHIDAPAEEKVAEKQARLEGCATVSERNGEKESLEEA
jgi:Major Facilitator Superfamily